MSRDQGGEPRWYILVSALAAVATIITLFITISSHQGNTSTTSTGTNNSGNVGFVQPTDTMQPIGATAPTDTPFPVAATAGNYTGCLMSSAGAPPIGLTLTMGRSDNSGHVTGSIAFSQTHDTLTGAVTPDTYGPSKLQFKLDNHNATFSATVYGSSEGNYFTGTYVFPNPDGGAATGNWYAYPDTLYCNR